MTIKIEITPQKIYAKIIAYMLSFLGLITLVNSITNEIGMASEWDSYFVIGVLLVLMLIGFYFLLCERIKSRGDCLIVFAFFVFSYLSSLVWFPQNGKYLFTTMTDFFNNPVYTLFVLSVPGYLFSRQLKDYHLFFKIMIRYAYVVVVLSAIVFLFVKNQ